MIGLLAGLLQRVKAIKGSQALTLLALGVAAVIGGAFAFGATQHVRFSIALYWAVTTATTVGYGDVTPHNGAGRLIAIVEMVTAIPLFGGVFASLTALLASATLRKVLRLDEHRAPNEPFVALYGDEPVLVRVAESLAQAGTRVLVVGTPAHLGEEHGDEVRTILESPTAERVVRRSAPTRAQQALVACVEEADTLVTAVHLRHLAPSLRVTALVRSQPIAQALKDLGTETVISLEQLVGNLLAASLETPHAGQLLTSLVESDRYRLSEIAVPEQRLGSRLSALRDDATRVVLAAIHEGAVVYGADEDPELGDGDRLLVLEQRRHL